MVGGAVALAALAIGLRVGPLGPSSLWLDDAWVALISRAHGAGDVWTMGFTFPGFAVLLRLWFGVVGFSETTAQVLPFAFGVAGPALLWWVCVRRGLTVGASLVAAGVLLASPVHLEYSTRVKSYTLDALLAIGLLAAGWWLIDQPRSARRWAVAVGAAAAATMMSAAVAPYALAIVVAGALAGGLVEALVAGAAYGGFALVWWFAALDRAVNPGLRAYWHDFYVDGVGDLASGLHRLLDGFAPLPVWVTALVLVAAGVGLAARRPALLLLLGVPVLVAVGLAVMEMAPLGGGRTDTFLYPALAVAVAAGLEPFLTRWWVGAAVIGGLAVLAPTAGPYPREDVRPLVAFVESERSADEAVLVYPATRWAYALYTSSPVRFSRDPDDAPGYSAAIAHSPYHVHVLPPAGRVDPARYELLVQTVVSDHGGLWLVASHWRSDLADLYAALDAFGLTEVGRWERPGAVLTRWEPRA